MKVVEVQFHRRPINIFLMIASKFWQLESKKLHFRLVQEAEVMKIFQSSKKWSKEANVLKYQILKNPDDTQYQQKYQQLKLQFKKEARKQASLVGQNEDFISLFTIFNKQKCYIRNGILFRDVFQVSNCNERFTQNQLILQYYQNQISSSERIRGRDLSLIPPLSIMVYSHKLQKIILAQSFLPLHFRLLMYGFLKFPDILISSQNIEKNHLIPLLKQFSLCHSFLKNSSKLNESKVLLQFTCSVFHDPNEKSDNYLFNLGFFFPSLTSQTNNPFDLVNPNALVKFSRQNLPDNLLQLPNDLQIKCSQCKQYIIDDIYYKIMQHKLTPSRLKSYICCQQCFIDHQELGNQLQINPQKLRKKQVPLNAKKRNYINEATLKRYDTLSDIKNLISANEMSDYIQDTYQNDNLIQKLDEYIAQELIPQCVRQLNKLLKSKQSQSIFVSLIQIMEQCGIALTCMELILKQIDSKTAIKIKECIWEESKNEMKQISRNPDAFQQSVKKWFSQPLISVNQRIQRKYGMKFVEELIFKFNPKSL